MTDEVTQEADTKAGASRREFLAWTGTAVGSAALVAAFGRLAEDPALLEQLADRTAAVVTSDPFGDSLLLRRPGDQCLLTFAFFNLRVDPTTSPPVLNKISPEVDAFMIVEFGPVSALAPMHVAEQAFPLVAPALDGAAQKKAPTPVPTSTAPVKSPPIDARIAGGSRLVFEIPNSLLPYPVDTAHLLNWTGLGLSVVPNAAPPFTLSVRGSIPPGLGAPRAPSATETAIELPYNLVISPPATPEFGNSSEFAPVTIFVNAIDPVTHNGWTELWHTRLAAKSFKTVGEFGGLFVDETDRDLRTVRAVWCRDARFLGDVRANRSDNQIPDDHDPEFHPTTTSLSYEDRYDIVRLSSDFTPSSKGGPFRRPSSTNSLGYVPSPATVDRLMLTSLGGWLDCDAHWDLPAPTGRGAHFSSSLLSWRQRTVQGRDSYVRVVRKGYLFPWGHRASLVTVTEREFSVQGGAGGPVGAYLRQKTFIVVTAPTKKYGAESQFARYDGRHLPFTVVESLTLVTPDLEKPAKYVTTGGVQIQAESVFEPMTATGPFDFHFRGTDWAGDPIDLRTPVLWIDDTIAYGTNGSTALMDAVIKKWQADYPAITLHNQRVSVAEPKDPAAVTGDTQVVIATFELGVERPLAGTSAAQLIEASQPAFYPTMHSLAVNLPQAGTVSGNAVGATTMQYELDHYLTAGFVGNKGGVFLKRPSAEPRRTITFNAAKAGGAITPNLGIDGYSREIGPVSGAAPTSIANLAQGTFDPKDVFAGVDAKLLGGLDLTTILGQVSFGDGDANGNAQALQITSVERHDPHRIVTMLDWHPTIKPGGPTVGTPAQQITVFVPTGGTLDADGNTLDSMDLHAVIVTDLDTPANSTSTVVGQLRNFELDLFGNAGSEYFIQLPFDSLTFRAQSGKKTDVDVQVGAGGVQFQGALSFVQDLASFLNFDGSGLTVDTSGTAITATLTLAIPTIAVGIFSLSNLAFSAGVAIPYNGDPVRFTFAFCSAENPFQLTIMIFAGGGFIEIGIGPDGVESLAFSFDFGLGFSIDLGIASGQVSLTGGVYYEADKQDDGEQSVDLTAWVKASGGVSALGLVSVSVELYLGLGYQSDGPGTAKLVGDAEMSISVHIIFFGFTVGFDVHEEFDVSDDDTPAVAQPAARRRKSVAASPDHDRADDRPDAGEPPAAPPAKPDQNLFGTSMPTPEDWAAYCTSFALVGQGA